MGVVINIAKLIPLLVVISVLATIKDFYASVSSVRGAAAFLGAAVSPPHCLTCGADGLLGGSTRAGMK